MKPLHPTDLVHDLAMYVKRHARDHRPGAPDRAAAGRAPARRDSERDGRRTRREERGGRAKLEHDDFVGALEVWGGEVFVNIPREGGQGKARADWLHVTD